MLGKAYLQKDRHYDKFLVYVKEAHTSKREASSKILLPTTSVVRGPEKILHPNFPAVM